MTESGEHGGGVLGENHYVNRQYSLGENPYAARRARAFFRLKLFFKKDEKGLATLALSLHNRPNRTNNPTGAKTMKEEFDVRLAEMPADTETPADVAGLLFSFEQEELDRMAAGQAVVVETDDAVFHVRAPWLVAIFNSQHPDMKEKRIVGWDADELGDQARALARQMVGAENAHRHGVRIMAANTVPDWHGKDAPRPQRRVKDDVCAWEHVQGF
jgi:hypothetical protein